MALVVADRIQETTTTTGTGTYTLAGAKDGFVSFSGIGDGNTTYYACTDGTDFEVGIGTYTASGTTLARTTILASTNSNNAVDWSAGSKDIFVTLPAGKSVIQDASGNVDLGSTITMLNTTEEDGEGGRANKIIFKGEQSGGEESVLAEIQASHDGTADDEKGDLIFRTNDGSDGTSPTEAARIDSGQNLLVASSDPDPSANSAGSTADNGVAITALGEVRAARFLSSAGSGAVGLFNRTGTDGDVLRIRKNGADVGSIGNSGGAMYVSAALTGGLKYTYLNGTNALTQPCNTTGTTTDGTHDLGSSGARFRNLYLSGTANALQFTATSDLAKKANLEVVEDALNKVQSLTGYTYDIKENGSRKAGLIAQDVEKVLPEAVNGDEGDKTLDYSATIALLVNAIKEQQAQIEELKMLLRNK